MNVEVEEPCRKNKDHVVSRFDDHGMVAHPILMSDFVDRLQFLHTAYDAYSSKNILLPI